MSVMNTVTYSYGLASVLLLFSFFVFQTSLRVTRYFKVSLRPSQLLRIAQSLVLVALLIAPIATNLGSSLLSRWVTSPVTFSTQDVTQLAGPDGGSNLVQTSQKVEVPMPEEKATKTGLTFQSIFNTGALLVAFSLGLFAALTKLLLKVRSLYALLRSSTVLRKIRNTEILVTDEITVPFSTMALLRAHVVVPIQILESRNTLKIAIQHEIQHHRNGDTLWIILMEILGVLFYWNPALYLWRRRLEELLEFACDETLITKGGIPAKSYGSCLVQVAETYIKNTKPLFGSVGMAIGYSDSTQKGPLLNRRIQMLFKYKLEKTNMKDALFTGGVAIGTLLAFASIMGGKTEASVEHNMVFDPEIQKIANQAVLDGVKSAKARDGYAVVTDPQNGRVLAISYVDGNSEKALDDKKAADLVLSTTSQPNSLIKPITVAYALEHGKVTADEKINCENGQYKIGDKTYGDHEKFSALTTSETIAHSSDIGAIKVAERIGDEDLARAFSEFGFGHKEIASLLGKSVQGKIVRTSKDSPSTFVPEFANGQNTSVTPIEITQAYGALANGGKVLKANTYNNIQENSAIIGKAISPQTSEKMRKILQTTVTDGTGKKAKPLHYSAAGKTGTGFAYTHPSETVQPQEMLYDRRKGIAQFVGFAPVSAPKVLVYVVIEGAENKTWGGVHAAPVFSVITEKTLQHLKVKPDQI